MTDTYEINYYGMVTFHGNGSDIAYFRPHIMNPLLNCTYVTKMRQVATGISGSPALVGQFINGPLPFNGLFWGSSASNHKLVTNPSSFESLTGTPTVLNFSVPTSGAIPSSIFFYQIASTNVYWISKFITVSTNGNFSNASWVGATSELVSGSILPLSGNVLNTDFVGVTGAKTKSAQHVALVTSSGSAYPGFTTLASGGKTWQVAGGTFGQSYANSGAIAKTGTDTYRLFYADSSGGVIKTKTSTDGGLNYADTSDVVLNPSVKGVVIAPSNQNPSTPSDGYNIVGAAHHHYNGDVYLALGPASNVSGTTPQGFERDFSSLSRHPHPRGIYILRSSDSGASFSIYMFIPMNYGSVTPQTFCMYNLHGIGGLSAAYYDYYTPKGLDNLPTSALFCASLPTIGKR